MKSIIVRKENMSIAEEKKNNLHVKRKEWNIRNITEEVIIGKVIVSKKENKVVRLINAILYLYIRIKSMKKETHIFILIAMNIANIS